MKFNFAQIFGSILGILILITVWIVNTIKINGVPTELSFFLRLILSVVLICFIVFLNFFYRTNTAQTSGALSVAAKTTGVFMTIDSGKYIVGSLIFFVAGLIFLIYSFFTNSAFAFFGIVLLLASVGWFISFRIRRKKAEDLLQGRV